MKSLVIASILLISLNNLACAQYNYQGGASHSPGGFGDTGGGGEHDGGIDERPRVNLGIRLRIPAFKFELPRFNLPKITVSAKIRQPEGPRVIQLPEINLDTSSKSELPGVGAGSHHQSSAYGMGASSSYGLGQTGEISFSTGQEHPAHHDRHQTMAYKTSFPTHGAAYGQPQGPRYSYQPQHRPQQSGYGSATNVRPTYWASGNAAAGQSAARYRPQQQEERDKSPDVGFNLPAYADLGAVGAK